MDLKSKKERKEMGIFDKFKKKTEVKQEEVKKEAPKQGAAKQEDDVITAGWDAITEEFERIYPGQTDPKHYGTLIKWRFGGNEPLDGISIYDGGDYWHFVGYGLSELYEKESPNLEISGYGMEYTFKLKKEQYEDEEGEIRGICVILQTLARLTARDGEIFSPYEYIYTGQTTGIDIHQKSNITGFICIPDPTVNTLQTPNGRVEFLEFIGMTDAELKTLKTHDSVKQIYEKLGSDVTDYHRLSLV